MLCPGRADYPGLAGRACRSQQGCGLPLGVGGSPVLQCLVRRKSLCSSPLLADTSLLLPLSPSRSVVPDDQIPWWASSAAQAQWEGMTTRPAFTYLPRARPFPALPESPSASLQNQSGHVAAASKPGRLLRSSQTPERMQRPGTAVSVHVSGWERGVPAWWCWQS